MDEYKHCLNCIVVRVAIFMMEKGTFKKEYYSLLKWFKDTYELRRKHDKEVIK